jgi:hypothetical protein
MSEAEHFEMLVLGSGEGGKSVKPGSNRRRRRPDGRHGSRRGFS